MPYNGLRLGAGGDFTTELSTKPNIQIYENLSYEARQPRLRQTAVSGSILFVSFCFVVYRDDDFIFLVSNCYWLSTVEAHVLKPLSTKSDFGEYNIPMIWPWNVLFVHFQLSLSRLLKIFFLLHDNNLLLQDYNK